MSSRNQRSAHTNVPVTKWSIKSAEHGRDRVRNNQRRHRERVKCRIKDLEAKLAETQIELQEALATIERLNSQLEGRQPALRMPLPNSPTVDVLTVDPGRLIHLPSVADLDSLRSPLSTSSESQINEAASNTIGVDDEMDCPQGTLCASCTTQPLLGQLPGIGRWYEHTGPYSEQLASMSDGDGDQMEPPKPDESTTRCRDAFKIIAEQNYASIDIASMCTWLQPGFRRAHSEGDGCRVENTLLFTLLGHISS